MALQELLADVTVPMIRSHLLERPLEILETDPPNADLEARIAGAAVEVLLITGPDPQSARVRALAVEAIAVQTASELEYTAFPEQQAPGDTGRGYLLHQRYLELLKRLQSLADSGSIPGTETPPSVARPVASFPPPQPMPDPSLAETWY